MFEWTHEYSRVVPTSLQSVWEFYINSDNWPKWLKDFKSFAYEKHLQVGSIVKAKIKKRNSYIVLTVKEIDLLKNLSLEIKIPFFSQESRITFIKISPSKSQIILINSVSSPFTPFLKSFYSKKSETQFLKCMDLIEKLE